MKVGVSFVFILLQFVPPPFTPERQCVCLHAHTFTAQTAQDYWADRHFPAIYTEITAPVPSTRQSKLSSLPFTYKTSCCFFCDLFPPNGRS